LYNIVGVIKTNSTHYRKYWYFIDHFYWYFIDWVYTERTILLKHLKI